MRRQSRRRQSPAARSAHSALPPPEYGGHAGVPRLQVTTTEDYFRDRARKAGQETPGSDDDDRPLEGCGPQRQQHPGLPMSVGTVIGSDGVVRPAHSPYVCMAAPVSTQGGVLIPRGMAAGAHQVAGTSLAWG